MPVDHSTRQPEVPTSVYKYYDANGVLIYVGITRQASSRNRQHNADKEWWRFVESQKVEHLPSRLCARNRERDLILLHRPPFNRVHNREHVVLKAAYLSLASMERETDPKKLFFSARGRLAVQVIHGHIYSRLEDQALAVCVKYPPAELVEPLIFDKHGIQIGMVKAVERGASVVKFHTMFRNEARNRVDTKTGFVKIRHNQFKKSSFECYAGHIHLDCDTR